MPVPWLDRRRRCRLRPLRRRAGRRRRACRRRSVAIVSTAGKLAFDSIVQRDAPDANRGRSFARFETRFQLVWVIGALIPVLLLPIPRRGSAFVIVAGTSAFALLSPTSHGQRGGPPWRRGPIDRRARARGAARRPRTVGRTPPRSTSAPPIVRRVRRSRRPTQSASRRPSTSTRRRW